MAWPVVVTIHNLVNFPPAALDGSASCTYIIEVRPVHAETALEPTACTVPRVSFSSFEVVTSHAGMHEVRLDDTRHTHRGSSGSQSWLCRTAVVDVVVVVLERPSLYVEDDASPPARIVGSSATLSIAIRDIVLRRKLQTFVVGTEMGQVGLSISVDPADRSGYRARLTKFLQQHNPHGLHLVPSVVDVVPEVDTFTKLSRKYGLVDYGKRLHTFFCVYGPDYVDDIPSLLSQWENREEELMRNLILDNGPELQDIDVDKRLTAFLAAHHLHRSDPKVAPLLRRGLNGGDAASMFQALVARCGPEPDPRTYLFPSPQYLPPPSSAAAATRVAPPARESSALSAPSPNGQSSASGARSSESESVAAVERGHTDPMLHVGVASGASRATAPPVPNGAGPAPNFPGAGEGYYEHTLFAGNADVPVGIPSASQRPPLSVQPHHPTRSETLPDRTDDAPKTGQLWSQFMSALSSRPDHPQPRDLCYYTPRRFAQFLEDQGIYSYAEREALTHDWLARMGPQTLREEYWDAASVPYDAAVKEVTSLLNLAPLQLQVLSVSSLSHTAREEAFQERLAQAQTRRTERWALVGDYSAMREVVECGVCPATHLWGKGRTRDATPGVAPCAVFVREPCRDWSQPRPVCVLVCDVIPDRTCTLSSDTDEAAPATAEFLSRYDSCAFAARVGGPALAIYAPQQMRVRLIVQCRVDLTSVPCPSHPQRPVEYYLPAVRVFACSRCVIEGRYSSAGGDVLTLDEAGQRARAQLAAMHREAEGITKSVRAAEKRLAEEEAAMAATPRRWRAQQSIDQIRREAAERIARIEAELSTADREQRESIEVRRGDLAAARETAQAITQSVEAILHGETPRTAIQVVEAEQQARRENALPLLRQRLVARVPEVDLEPSATTADTRAVRRPPLSDYGLNESRGTVAAPDRSYPPLHGSPYRYPRGLMKELPRRAAASVTDERGPVPSRCHERSGDASTYEGGGSRHPASRSSSRPSGHGLENASTPSQFAAPVPPGKRHRTAAEAAEALSRGWMLLRAGDKEGAGTVWRHVAQAHGPTEAVGARARAYLAETVEKEYEAAGQWYAKSLAIEPADRQTAYNYAVLLDALLARPAEALAWYDHAATLGDTVAAARAKQLRVQLSVAL